MARLVRYVWPTLVLAWLVAIAGAGPGASGPAALLPAILLATVALALVSIVDTSDGVMAAIGVGMARRTRAVTVLRSRDPDAAGRIRPRAPGA